MDGGGAVQGAAGAPAPGALAPASRRRPRPAPLGQRGTLLGQLLGGRGRAAGQLLGSCFRARPAETRSTPCCTRMHASVAGACGLERRIRLCSPGPGPVPAGPQTRARGRRRGQRRRGAGGSPGGSGGQGEEQAEVRRFLSVPAAGQAAQRWVGGGVVLLSLVCCCPLGVVEPAGVTPGACQLGTRRRPGACPRWRPCACLQSWWGCRRSSRRTGDASPSCGRRGASSRADELRRRQPRLRRRRRRRRRREGRRQAAPLLQHAGAHSPATGAASSSNVHHAGGGAASPCCCGDGGRGAPALLREGAPARGRSAREAARAGRIAHTNKLAAHLTA